MQGGVQSGVQNPDQSVLKGVLALRANKQATAFSYDDLRKRYFLLRTVLPRKPRKLFPLAGYSFAAPSFQLHPVFGAASSRVPPGDTMSRFVGFGDKSWDNSKNFFQTQGFEFLFLSQRARRDAFASSISPKTPVLKLNRPFARKPPATIASESTRAAFMLVEKPQVAALRRPRVK